MTKNSTGFRRVRRPRSKSALLDRLTESDGAKLSPFDTYREVIVFCAALGCWRNRRVPFDESDEPIRWEAMVALRGTEAFVNMLAVTQTDDPTILSENRFDDRIIIFEEYANGGLEILGELIDKTPQPLVDIVRDLVAQVEDIHTNEESVIDLTNIS